jgi:hypothetical protein
MEFLEDPDPAVRLPRGGKTGPVLILYRTAVEFCQRMTSSYRITSGAEIARAPTPPAMPIMLLRKTILLVMVGFRMLLLGLVTRFVLVTVGPMADYTFVRGPTETVRTAKPQ